MELVRLASDSRTKPQLQGATTREGLLCASLLVRLFLVLGPLDVHSVGRIAVSLVPSETMGGGRASDGIWKRPPKRVNNVCRGCKTWAPLSLFELSLDERHEQGVLARPQESTGASPLNGRHAGWLCDSPACTVGDVIHLLATNLILMPVGYRIWAVWVVESWVRWGLSDVSYLRMMPGNAALFRRHEEWRGGASREECEAECALIMARLDSLAQVLVEITADVSRLRDMCRGEAPAKRRRVQEQPPHPWRGLPIEEEAPASPVSEGLDLDPDPPARTFTLRSQQRSRRHYKISYLDDDCTVGDLHFEFARIAKRGALLFQLVQANVPPVGTQSLRELDHTIDIMVSIYDFANQGQEPPSARRRGGFLRGGAPSSVRARLARKIGKSAQPLPKAIELIQQLWTVESEVLRASSGSPDQIRALVSSLAQKHGAVFSAGEWHINPQMTTPPATAGVQGCSSFDLSGSGVGSGAPKSLLIKEPPKRVSEYEQLTVVSQLVGPDGASLPQLVRSEYTLGARGFVLCDSCYLGAFAHLGEQADVMILLNGPLSKSSMWEARKAQVMVLRDEGRKVITCWIVSCSRNKYTIVHPVAEITPVQSEAVCLSVRVIRDVVSSSTLEAMCRRDFLSVFFGPLSKVLRIIGKKEQSSPSALIWQDAQGMISSLP